MFVLFYDFLYICFMFFFFFFFFFFFCCCYVFVFLFFVFFNIILRAEITSVARKKITSNSNLQSSLLRCDTRPNESDAPVRFELTRVGLLV